MKLKEFIEKLSQLDPELEVLISTERDYDGVSIWEDPVFECTAILDSNIGYTLEHLFIGG